MAHRYSTKAQVTVSIAPIDPVKGATQPEEPTILLSMTLEKHLACEAARVCAAAVVNLYTTGADWSIGSDMSPDTEDLWPDAQPATTSYTPELHCEHCGAEFHQVVPPVQTPNRWYAPSCTCFDEAFRTAGVPTLDEATAVTELPECEVCGASYRFMALPEIPGHALNDGFSSGVTPTCDCEKKGKAT